MAREGDPDPILARWGWEWDKGPGRARTDTWDLARIQAMRERLREGGRRGGRRSGEVRAARAAEAGRGPDCRLTSEERAEITAAAARLGVARGELLAAIVREWLYGPRGRRRKGA
jgi:hypothetical protein